MCINQTHFHVRAGFYFMLALAVLTVPLNWLCAWILAAVMHELGHAVAICLCGYHIASVELDWNGAKMRTPPLEKREWICALAGPVFGFSLLLLVRWFPRVAICGTLQALYNLLPVYPMDGGRVLKGLLQLVLKDSAAARITDSVGLTLTGIGFILLFRLVNMYIKLILLIFFAGILLKRAAIKFPCKERQKRVQ